VSCTEQQGRKDGEESENNQRCACIFYQNDRRRDLTLPNSDSLCVRQRHEHTRAARTPLAVEDERASSALPWHRRRTRRESAHSIASPFSLFRGYRAPDMENHEWERNTIMNLPAYYSLDSRRDGCLMANDKPAHQTRGRSKSMDLRSQQAASRVTATHSLGNKSSVGRV
jgi:hypothetical protein